MQGKRAVGGMEGRGDTSHYPRSERFSERLVWRSGDFLNFTHPAPLAARSSRGAKVLQDVLKLTGRRERLLTAVGWLGGGRIQLQIEPLPGSVGRLVSQRAMQHSEPLAAARVGGEVDF